MQINNIRIISPKFDPTESWSEAEVLGAMVFLWGQQSYYREGSIESALANLLPIIRYQNFCLFIKNGQPIGYVNWVYFSEKEAAAYAKNRKEYLHYLETCSQPIPGKKIWILTSFFPNGQVHQSRKILRDIIFKNNDVFFIYHKSSEKPLIKMFSGTQVKNKPIHSA